MYWSIAEMAADYDLTSREAAAYAQETTTGEPTVWALEHGLRLAGQPGWAGAWESAQAGGTDRPGKDPGVITDGMILSAVQAVINAGT